MKQKLPVFATVGALAWGMGAYKAYQNGAVNAGYGTDAVTYYMTGYNKLTNKWSASALLINSAPLIAGVAMSALASKTGFNRYLKGIPMVKA